MDTVLKQVMLALLGQVRGIEGLFERTFFATSMFGVASIVMMSIVTIIFQVAYSILSERMEKPRAESAWMFTNQPVHWAVTALSFLVCGPVFFLGLAASVWLAALK